MLIRNLDDHLLADYKRAAAQHGGSPEAELRAALLAQRPKQRLSASEIMALSGALRARTPAAAAVVKSTLLIREDRDAH